MPNIRYNLIITLFLLSHNAFGQQHMLNTQGKAIVNANGDTIMLKGMGLGGWMVQEGYMLQTAGFANPQHEIKATIKELIGKENTDTFYTRWLNNYVRKADIDSLKRWGFNSVRLPMHYNLYTLPIEDEPVKGKQTWLELGFALTDSVVKWCSENEIYVVLDLHAAPGGQGYDAGISDYNPNKPSLFESKDNRDKMVALWKKLAERYVDEEWIAGYDLLNEPNWDLPGNVLLRQIYVECTDSIRTVDKNHIIFIEGNWFANDFTGLTPPWDDKLVYSPHKYWSYNDEATMQWVIDLRNDHNVPLYLGETGENSNVWFRDCIRLMQDLEIGWAWWPVKKIESISGCMHIEKTADYQSLLDYWSNGGTRPTVEFAKNTLFDLTEKLKAENCIVQRDVIDAMFRQVNSDETIPFKKHKVPGIIFATDYDLGVMGQAYNDFDYGNYSVSSGNYNPWNNGWIYRNDGVDIERSADTLRSNGFNVGWMQTNEWMKYSIDAEESGVYEIRLRVAVGGSGGFIHFSTGDAGITKRVFVGPTGGWQTWKNLKIEDVILNQNDKSIVLYVDQAGFNISSFEFLKTEKNVEDIETTFLSGETHDEYTLKISINKRLKENTNVKAEDFEVMVDGNPFKIKSVAQSLNNAKLIFIESEEIFKSTHDIRVFYEGTEIEAFDNTMLKTFNDERVRNSLAFVHQIPGKIEAEAFTVQSGTALEETTDDGGGQNISYLDVNDYLDYDIYINQTDNYKIEYRTAAQNATGGIKLIFFNENDTISLDQTTFKATGDWQDWATTSVNAQLTKGRYTMRIQITRSLFNLNWITFLASNSINNTEAANIVIYPNPSNDFIYIDAKKIAADIKSYKLVSLNGKVIITDSLDHSAMTISLQGLKPGIYFLQFETKNQGILTKKIIKN